MKTITALPPALAGLLPPALQAACAPARLEKGSLLFRLGQRPGWMHYVRSGEVVLERPGLHGGSVVLQRCRQGFVGEASLQSDSYHCDARAVAPAELTRLPIQAVREALASDPAFASRWIGMLNREVRRLRMQSERLSLPRLRDRLLHLIETEDQQGRLALGSSLKSLAAELGVTHEALYRCVASLTKEGRLLRSPDALQLAPALSAPPGGPAPRP